MIVEALIGGATVCFVASLHFAKWCVTRESRAEPREAGPKRKAIEKELQEWHNKPQFPGVLDRITQLERQLFELGDDE